jgi:hypothetical protein
MIEINKIDELNSQILDNNEEIFFDNYRIEKIEDDLYSIIRAFESFEELKNYLSNNQINKGI